MKKVFALISLAVLAICSVSCLDGSSKYSYTLATSFEYQQVSSDESFFGDLSYFGKYDLLYDVVRFNGVRETEDSLLVGGFALCYKKDSVIAGKSAADFDPYTMYESDTLYYDSRNHFVVYTQNDDPAKNPARPIYFIYYDYTGCTCTAQQVFLANTTASYVALKDAPAGTQADVVFTGYAGGEKTGEVTVSLFNEGKPLSTWKSFDLSALGEIEYVTVEIKSTDNIVKAFALDNLICSITLEY